VRRSEEKKLHVMVLYSEGCPATGETIRLLRDCAAESDVPFELQTELIVTQDDADRTRFLGSPTVQIEGMDIDPSARDCYVFGFV
jgi:hypothetical protein